MAASNDSFYRVCTEAAHVLVHKGILEYHAVRNTRNPVRTHECNRMTVCAVEPSFHDHAHSPAADFISTAGDISVLFKMHTTVQIANYHEMYNE